MDVPFTMVFNIVAMTLACGLLARGPTLRTGCAINIALASTGPGDLLWVNSGINWGRRIRRAAVDLYQIVCILQEKLEEI